MQGTDIVPEEHGDSCNMGQLSRAPKVSIGMPVYNGAKYIRQTLDSIVGQTYTDFEVIISDNGSIDGTDVICCEYAQNDNRIRYYPNSQNRGAAWNFNRVFQLARGIYFKWAAHDDLLAPEMIERCVHSLDSHPDAVVCFPLTKAIDQSGNVLRAYPSKPGGKSSLPHERFYEFVCVPHPCVAVFGLIRTHELAKTRLMGTFPSADRQLLGELSLLGQFYEIPEHLFFYRNHAEQSWQKYPTKMALRAWYDPGHVTNWAFPQWRLLIEHFCSIARVKLAWNERLYCVCYLMYWVRLNWRLLASNLVLKEA